MWSSEYGESSSSGAKSAHLRMYATIKNTAGATTTMRTRTMILTATSPPLGLLPAVASDSDVRTKGLAYELATLEKLSAVARMDLNCEFFSLDASVDTEKS